MNRTQVLLKKTRPQHGVVEPELADFLFNRFVWAKRVALDRSRQTDFDQRAEKWVTTFGGWRWPYYRAPRKVGIGHSNFGTWSNLHRRQHTLG